MREKFSSSARSRIHPASIVCDSSSLITITDAGLIGALVFLRPFVKGEFIITPTVRREAIDKPTKMPEYAFSAVRLRRALDDGVFRVVAPKKEIADKILSLANSAFSTNGKMIRILHRGEAELFAIAVEHSLKTILIDERTARLIVEDCGAIAAHLEKELGVKIEQDKSTIGEIQRMLDDIRVIRSTEIIVLAHENGYFAKFRELERDAFIAAMWATKFNGCAIGYDEIEEIVREIK